MTRWRTELAKAVHKRNPDLDAHALTDIVQRLLDRFIFIRVAEDRRIIEKKSLLDRADDWAAMGGRKPLLPMVNDLFHQINDDFNGDIFKPHPCEEIKLDDPALHRIIKELYPPKSPYRFDVIPVDIFGAVYERYLGKTIHVRGKDVKVEDKPEVRKAGGVYYTPKYIVDYIVKNAVGKVIAGKTPKQIEKIKILDPACGSGSFLLRAFQYLIDYHVAWYEKHKKEAFRHPMYPELVKESDGSHRLSIHRKATILRNNLHGVDLDPQAVEITMMNLYLKALENERDLPQKQHLLPELGRNIRCGNSLIAPDIQQEQELSKEELRQLNPFDWHSKTDGFGDILGPAEGPERSRGSGFDAVIGNPPYVSFGLRGVGHAEKSWASYIRKKFPNSAQYKLSTYALFLDRAVQLTGRGGHTSYILPDSFLVGQYFSKLRRSLLDSCRIKEIVLFAKDFWRSGMVGKPVIIVLQRRPNQLSNRKNSLSATLALSPEDLVDGNVHSYSYSQSYFESIHLNRFRLFFEPWAKSLVEKIESGSVRVGDLSSIHTGVRSKIGQKNIIAETKKGSTWHKGIISGSQVTPFKVHWSGHYINIKPRILWSGGWDPDVVNRKKILIRQTGDSIVCSIDAQKLYHLNNVHSLVLRSKKVSLEFLAALLNSDLLNHFYQLVTLEYRRPMAQTDIETLEQLPIWLPDKQIASKIEALVRKLEKHALSSSSFKQIKQKLNQLVTDLYKLTPGERRTLAKRLTDPYNLDSLQSAKEEF